MSARKQKRSREAEEEGTPPTKRRAVDQAAPSMFDLKPKVGMRLDARDKDYIWSQATIVKVHFRKKQRQHVTVRFDGWIQTYDETVEWNSNRLAPLHSFSKIVKCFVNLMPPPTKKKTPTKQLEFCNSVPCKVQLRMPHPIVEGEDDEEDCQDAQESLRSEMNVFIQPYETQHVPRRLERSLKEMGGIWLEFTRVQPWNHNPMELPEHFRQAFHLAEMDEETPGELFSTDIMEQGSLLKEEYQVRTREGALVRDGVLRKENDEEEEEEEEMEVVEEHAARQEEDEDEEEFVVTATCTKTKAQPEPMQQEPVQQAPKETQKLEKKSFTSNCIIS